jgi:DNA replication and repair protein RecF
MYLQQLSLINFKNYAELTLNFSEKMNCFVGNNGMGKTNLLDAVYYLCFCKSFFNATDAQNIRHDTPFFMVEGFFNKQGEEIDLHIGFKRGQKKTVKRNKVEYEKLSDHIGLFPLVMISPADSELIYGTSEMRRKFLDGIISQYDNGYLKTLVAYNRVVKQRNSLLKQFYEQRFFDEETLSVWDEQLIYYGDELLQKRSLFLGEFIPLFNSYYHFLSNGAEIVNCVYEKSNVNLLLREAVKNSIQKDRALQYSTTGPHKDELEFTIDAYSLKKFASQGQQKTFLLALKLAQFEFIKTKKGVKPILLLDDIYDKFDAARFTRLMDIVSGDGFGQVFLSDTHPERMRELLQRRKMEHKLFLVESGTASEIN